MCDALWSVQFHHTKKQTTHVCGNTVTSCCMHLRAATVLVRVALYPYGPASDAGARFPPVEGSTVCVCRYVYAYVSCGGLVCCFGFDFFWGGGDGRWRAEVGIDSFITAGPTQILSSLLLHLTYTHTHAPPIAAANTPQRRPSHAKNSLWNCACSPLAPPPPLLLLPEAVSSAEEEDSRRRWSRTPSCVLVFVLEC